MENSQAKTISEKTSDDGDALEAGAGNNMRRLRKTNTQNNSNSTPVDINMTGLEPQA